MTTLLQTYEEEYREQLRAANDELTALRATFARQAPGYKPPPSTGPGSRLQRGMTLNAHLGRLRELLSSMEYECNDLPAALRQAAKERVTGYRQAVQQVEAEVTKARVESSAADRDDLRGGGGDGAAAQGSGHTRNGNNSTAAAAKDTEMDEATRQHRQQMMHNTDTFRQASQALLRSERLLNDTEAVGNEALGTLRGQTETMHRIHETTIMADEEVSKSRQILSTMQRVMIKHKIILLGIILVLIFLIVVAVYASVARRQSYVTPEPTQVPVDPIPPTPNGW